jgi:hypothetical protein
MLLTLFTIFLILSLGLIALGYYSKEGVYSLVGSATIMLLGATILITGNLQYETGSTTTTTYSYINSTLATTSEVAVTNTTNFNDTSSRLLGFWLGLLGAFTIAINIFEIKGLKD